MGFTVIRDTDFTGLAVTVREMNGHQTAEITLKDWDGKYHSTVLSAEEAIKLAETIQAQVRPPEKS